jgi:hypothetical protein
MPCRWQVQTPAPGKNLKLDTLLAREMRVKLKKKVPEKKSLR